MENKFEKISVGVMIIIAVIGIVGLVYSHFSDNGLNLNETQTCENNDSSCNTLNIIKFMEEKNISIYGVETCGWCKKQLEEFGPHANYLKEKGLYVDCTPEISACQDVSATPAWKENGKIVYEGYIPLDKLIID